MLDAEVDDKYYLKKTLNITTKENYIQWDNSGKGYNSQQDRAYYQDGLSPTFYKPVCLNSKGGRNGIEGLQPSIQDRVYDSEAISTSVTTSYMPNFTHGLRIRKLTPKECWRLMGFDNEDFYKAEAVNSNSQLYKQAGNSIVVDVVVKIYEKLFERYGDVIK